MNRLWSTERGASAIIIASSLFLLMGMAAIAIDAGAGFNERRQDQTSADLAAVAAAVNGASEVNAVQAALSIARSNLNTTYSNAEWQALWQSCTDPDMPAGFSPVDDPWSGVSTDKLDCISSGIGRNGEAEIRVRIPEQDTETTFGRAVGVDRLTTDAEAHAGFRFTVGGDALPFGILYGTPAGAEQCVVQPPGGHAIGACNGPSSGNFGGVELPLWGSDEKGTTPNCSPGGFELSVNIAIGSDHIIAPAFGTADLDGDGDIDADDYPGSGGAHPGDAGIVSNGAPAGVASKLDACTVSGGEAIASDTLPSFPLNTVDVDTGFAGNDVKLGLIGDTTDPVFPNGALPRLRQVVNGQTIFVDEKDGPTTATYEVDNTPLWEYLRPQSELGGLLGGLAGPGNACNKNYIDGLTTFAAKRTTFMSCLASYSTLPNPPPLFTPAIADNPRFAWAPIFQFTTWGSGNGWQPIHSFLAIYLDGIWFNCNGNGTGSLTEACGGKKGLEWYPGELTNGATYTGRSSGSAINLRLDQVTAITIPTFALPQSVADSFPGKVRGPFTTGLLR